MNFYPISLFIYISLLMSIFYQIHAQIDLSFMPLLGFPKDQFDKYKIVSKYIGECRNPGYTDRSIMLTHKTEITEVNNEEEITGFVYVPQAHKVIKAIFIPEIWKNNNYKKLLLWSTNTPCIDPITSLPLLLTYHTNSSCIIKKGNYSLGGIYLDRYAHKFIGDKFIHGRCRVTVKYFAKKGCTYCIEIIIDIINPQKSM